MQEINLPFFFCMTKTPGSAKKIKIIINKSNFIFIPVLEKLGSADFVNQKNKKRWLKRVLRDMLTLTRALLKFERKPFYK